MKEINIKLQSTQSQNEGMLLKTKLIGCVRVKGNNNIKSYRTTSNIIKNHQMISIVSDYYRDKQHKPFSCLPQGGFNSGVCPGAAAITILYTYSGSPRGTLEGSHTPAVINRHSRMGRHSEKEDLPMI
jgi:hypothetical protein